MSNAPLYDTIGTTYALTRRTEPRIAEQVWAALGDARTVLNVGAGTGSYEPVDRDVTAVEPSAVMRAQRPQGSSRCVAATAEHLPFPDHSFDAAMAFATVHHWGDPIAGMREMRRVARRPSGGLHLRDDRTELAEPVLAATRLPARSRRLLCRSRHRTRQRDWRACGASARPVGLRGRILRGLLAPPRGVPGRGRSSRHLGVDCRRARRRATCGTQAPR